MKDEALVGKLMELRDFEVFFPQLVNSAAFSEPNKSKIIELFEDLAVKKKLESIEKDEAKHQDICDRILALLV